MREREEEKEREKQNIYYCLFTNVGCASRRR